MCGTNVLEFILLCPRLLKYLIITDSWITVYTFDAMMKYIMNADLIRLYLSALHYCLPCILHLRLCIEIQNTMCFCIEHVNPLRMLPRNCPHHLSRLLLIPITYTICDEMLKCVRNRPPPTVSRNIYISEHTASAVRQQCINNKDC